MFAVSEDVTPSFVPGMFTRGPLETRFGDGLSLAVVLQVVADEIGYLFLRVKHHDFFSIRIIFFEIVSVVRQQETTCTRDFKVPAFDLLAHAGHGRIGKVQIDVAPVEDTHHLVKWQPRYIGPAKTEHAQAESSAA